MLSKYYWQLGAIADTMKGWWGDYEGEACLARRGKGPEGEGPEDPG
jgi:hypothetical protein